jgi:beta-glucosidase
VPQVYVAPKAGGWEAPKRLAGFKKVSLAPGATPARDPDGRSAPAGDLGRQGPRLVDRGRPYDIALGASSRALTSTAQVTLAARNLPVSPAGK